MVEKQSGKEIKVLRIDRGGEFLSSEFTAYCDGHSKVATTPRTPE